MSCFGREHARRPSRRALVGPVEVRVGDHGFGGRCAPFALVFGRVRIADQRHVVPAGQRAVDRRADAGVGLCADDDKMADARRGEVLILRGIQERTGAQIDVEEDGTVFIACSDSEKAAIARAETERERQVIGLHRPFFYDG